MQLETYHDEKQALGGLATITLVTSLPSSIVHEKLASLWREIFYFEKKFSRFLPNSELTRFNKKAGIRVPVSPEMRSVLRAAQTWAVRTDGLYNPFILPALQRAGYKHSAVEGYQDDQTPDYTDRHSMPAASLEISDDWACIPHQAALDLGGMGKGYLLDALTAKLQHPAIVGFWLELSGDIISYGTDQDGRPIVIGIQSAKDTQQRHKKLQIVVDGSLLGVATSGTFRRTAEKSELRHHIIDPRTGMSAETDVVLATVCAPTALAADILASCAVIMGATKAPAFLAGCNASAWVLQYITASGAYDHTTHGSYVKEGN